jgi:hypothetical protein
MALWTVPGARSRGTATHSVVVVPFLCVIRVFCVIRVLCVIRDDALEFEEEACEERLGPRTLSAASSTALVST